MNHSFSHLIPLSCMDFLKHFDLFLRSHSSVVVFQDFYFTWADVLAPRRSSNFAEKEGLNLLTPKFDKLRFYLKTTYFKKFIGILLRFGFQG
ncbi:hypothetical protein AYI68_g3287 [Smittium mucronatum]|uniref:Uncharacterized protein n=1 Tax=Smittium mucronatum TaxID=133383 RepID=A0A1R0H0C8_9FUNG|nr:hypothetical protein AYI68_g3287 [Smittium mucronatum]